MVWDRISANSPNAACARRYVGRMRCPVAVRRFGTIQPHSNNAVVNAYALSGAVGIAVVAEPKLPSEQ